MATKTLLVFCDGTGMDGSLAPPKSGKSKIESDVTSESGIELPAPPIEGSAGGGDIQYPTNVLRLARSVKSLDKNGNRQIVFYQSGVGSEANFKGDPVSGTTVLQALGTAVASKIRDAYVFIAQNFQEGDEICLFGFSRGAYTVRKLAGLIDRIGLLSREYLGFFFEIWRQLIDGKPIDDPPGTRHPKIKCVGVWDTVGSVYEEIDALNIADKSLPKSIKLARHAISLHENRQKFLPTLWTVPEGGLQPGQDLKQVWFGGAHSDVGGGYERHELADISLYWMAGEVQDLINLDLEFLRTYSQPSPDPWGTSQPHNSYQESSWAVKQAVGHETRLESNDISTLSVFHPSLIASPAPRDPKYMITMAIIETQFGPHFTPDFWTLNTFEKYCKEKWGRLSKSRSGIEDPRLVIRPSVRWIRTESASPPSNTIVGGRIQQRTVYVARAPYQNGIYPGMLVGNVMWITYEGAKVSIQSPNYELLRGDKVHWIAVSGPLSIENLGAIPVMGGKDSDNEDIFVAQFKQAPDNTVCGRVAEGELARFLDGDKEKEEEYYNVLVFGPPEGSDQSV